MGRFQFVHTAVQLAETGMLLAIVLLQWSLCYSSVGAVEVYYVKPAGSTTECPSDNFPCHTLQYYANHSSFTNSSVFLFLVGEHHLDSVVQVSNVANLSLLGMTSISSEVKILCNSIPSGFSIRHFTGVIIENMAISNCTSTAVELRDGSEASLQNVIMDPSSGSLGLAAINVEGSFIVANSTFIVQTKNLVWLVDYYDTVDYSVCEVSCHFKYINNEVIKSGDFSTQFSLGIKCSGVQVEIMDSIFANELTGRLKMFVNYQVLTNNSVLVSNSIFKNTELITTTCSGDHCDENALRCSDDFITLRGINTNFGVGFHVRSPINNCTILIEDSVISDTLTPSNINSLVTFDFVYNPEKSVNDTSVQAILHNATFANNVNHEESSLCILRNSVVLFKDCSFDNNTSTAIQAFASKIIFEGENTFRSNTALVGGGMQLLNSSYLYLRRNTSILFANNHAVYVGGAIYTDFEEQDSCFFHAESPTINVNFFNNTANFSGSSLYGGGIHHCCVTSSCTCAEFTDIFNISNTEADPSAIASDPYDVCFCDDGKAQPNCANRSYPTDAYHGQNFPIRLAVVGSCGGVVPGAIRAYFNPAHDSTLGHSQNSQVSEKPFCKNFNYSVSSTENELITFKITAEQTFLKEITRDPKYQASSLSITVSLKPCPQGFSDENGTCVCDDVLRDTATLCNIDDQSFLRPANSWIGFVNEPNLTGVIFHHNCPIGYCLPQDVEITSNTSDDQCELHRTGLLCGECEDGYSLTLGNGECWKCSNTFLLLILPLAVAGLLLVAVLFALNLTVAEGSINGLIFYANVIGMNHNVLFSGQKSYLYTFVAWLNLDLGISTCLYDGMDGYAETWLQFAFPVYLWVIILVIILFYRNFPAHANRLGGENAVKVLATLLLLSYTKLQRTVVTILSFTWLEYPDGAVRYVWLYDANVEFFKGKHLYLGITGILILVSLIIPYTLCLAFFQQLQACSGHRLFQWVNKLKPVFDSYAGPYKDKYRFWTGTLLVVRTLLIILFSTAGSVNTNLLIISVVSLALLMAHSNGIYKKWPYNYLESFFYLQLGVFVAGVAYTGQDSGRITAVANTSFGASLLVFLIVVGYHVLISFKKYCYRHNGYADIAENISIERITT